jgi:hypothetical protein
VCDCVWLCVQLGKRWRRAKNTDAEESTLCLAVLALNKLTIHTWLSIKVLPNPSDQRRLAWKDGPMKTRKVLV